MAHKCRTTSIATGTEHQQVLIVDQLRNLGMENPDAASEVMHLFLPYMGKGLTHRRPPTLSIRLGEWGPIPAPCLRPIGGAIK
jgi:hypothetical protein